MKRLFLAAKVTASDNFMELYNDLRTKLQADKIKWVDPAKIHLTLKFFGDTAEEEIPFINKAVSTAVENSVPFDLHLRDVGIFGSSYKPRVIWIGIEPNDELKKLYINIKKELEEKGYEYDRQNFVPHLTLGRIRFIKNKKYFQKIIDNYKETDVQKDKIDELFLYESILHREGPEYKVVERFSL